MMDFLTGLIRRNIGKQPDIRPRTRPRFAADTQTEGLENTPLTQEEALIPSGKETGANSSNRANNIELYPAITGSQENSKKSVRNQRVTEETRTTLLPLKHVEIGKNFVSNKSESRKATQIAETQPLSQTSQESEKYNDNVEPVDSLLLPIDGRDQTITPVTSSMPRESHMREVLPAHQRKQGNVNYSSRESASGRAEGYTKDPPSINVTIGRVEVRAVHQQPPAPQRRQTNHQPTLSLNDYLQQRRRGER